MKAAARHGEEAVGEGTVGSGVHEPAAAIGEARSPPPLEWTGHITV
jgi:hypothetical protein